MIRIDSDSNLANHTVHIIRILQIICFELYDSDFPNNILKKCKSYDSHKFVMRITQTIKIYGLLPPEFSNSPSPSQVSCTPRGIA